MSRLVERQISDSVFAVSNRLPPESELCRSFALARSTVRESLRNLEYRGRIKMVPRRGVYVIDAEELILRLAEIVVDEPELTAIGAALIAAQGATGVAAPFGQGLHLRKIEPVAAWVEPYAGLYEYYRARLDASKGHSPIETINEKAD